MKTTQDIIGRLLSNIGTRKEVEQYLNQYARCESRKFAVIKVGGAILARQIDSLASSLTFLHHVGLFPIVVLGSGPQLDQALAEAGVPSERIDGLRVTTPEVLDVARRVFQSENLRLCAALEELSTRARPILSGVFLAEPQDPGRLGLVGRVVRVQGEPIEAAIRAGHLPILSCLGETPGGQILNVNADVAARGLARAIEPYKIIFLTETGGLLDGDGQLLSAVNLAEDFAPLLEQPWLHSGMRLKIQEIYELLSALPPSTSVSITSPEHLARELFTHRGSGTLLRMGERVQRYQDFANAAVIDRVRLRALLEDCFQRRLRDDYFVKKNFLSIYLADSYRATAIVTQESQAPIPYLDKFAVTQEAQGAGVGASIWQRMRRDYPKLFWRARADNPVNPWYFERADGCFKSDRWTVFYCGLRDFGEIGACVEQALALPATLEART